MSDKCLKELQCMSTKELIINCNKYIQQNATWQLNRTGILTNMDEIHILC